jgi:hypothetical protein
MAIRATVRALASAEILPGPFDCETLVPPVQRWWVRRVGVLTVFGVIVEPQ